MKSPEEIEKKAEEWMKGKELYATYDAHITGFCKGYNKCQEDNSDKRYTLDDMKKACAVGVDIVNKEGENNFKPFEDLINSLNKKD